MLDCGAWEIDGSAPNPKFAHVVLQAGANFGSKGHYKLPCA